MDLLVKKARLRLLKMHYESQHGHLGSNLSCIDAMIVLFHMVKNKNDKFILSKGHSAGALYITLWSLGILSEDDLLTFTKDNTRLSVHPPVKGLDDVIFGTGSLGHGPSLAAGLALSMRFKKQNDRVFCLCGDGEWQEGACWEALIFAVHQKLKNLTIIVDVNNWQGYGSLQEVASVDCSKLEKQFVSFGCNVMICDGHNITELQNKLADTNHQLETPTVILMQTRKGNGLPFFVDTLRCHYLPITAEQYDVGLKEFGHENA